MLFYSHWLDLVGKLTSIFLFVSLLLATNLVDVSESAMAATPNPKFFGIMLLGAILVGFYFAFHRPVVDVVMTMLYVRLRFGVVPSWEEAKLLRALFCLNVRTMKWYPMKHVRSLPIEQRLSVLVETSHAL
jgi:hypothetical protein